MPTYEYKCDACEYSFEIEQSIHAKHKKTCPKCKKKKLYQVFGTPYVYCYNVTTIGQWAEKNAKTKGKGKDQKSMREKIADAGLSKKEDAKNNPWWRSGEVKGLKKMEKPLNLSKIKNTKKYIEEGK